ncbi:PA domain-containing protein [Micromonospora rubida]|uniref:PA domain-containing protein n=1 Tax=Micromonospora rubida TaxID=2697657 RepID=UPI001377FB82|nr:PA domain-containing protein [Micromonospora rubida]NBE81266.1 hypothetical protein [Micromonospora rubida]
MHRAFAGAEPPGDGGSARFDGTKRLQVVSAGTGTSQEYAGLAVRGKTALVMRSAAISPDQQLANAVAAGASAVIVYNNAAERWGVDLWTRTPTAIPAMTLSGEQGGRLLDLLRRDRVTVEFKGVAVSPYAYELLQVEKGGLPANQRYQVRHNDLATLRTSYHASANGTEGGHFRSIWAPRQAVAYGTFDRLVMPLTRTEYVSAGLRTGQVTLLAPVWQLGGSQQIETVKVLSPGQRLSPHWNKSVVRTALSAESVDAAYRDNDLVVVQSSAMLDTGADHRQQSHLIQTDKVRASVYRNGEYLGSSNFAGFAFPALPFDRLRRGCRRQQPGQGRLPVRHRPHRPAPERAVRAGSAEREALGLLRRRRDLEVRRRRPEADGTVRVHRPAPEVGRDQRVRAAAGAGHRR